jgi:hypothetical protein
MSRARQSAGWLVSILVLAHLHQIHHVAAIPFLRNDFHEDGYLGLAPRQCPQYCGVGNVYCCGSGTQCYTTNGIAACSTPVGAGYGIYTTTWTETRTYTSTITTSWPAVAATTGSGTCVPKNAGESSCGWVCCADWQYCAYSGQCAAKPGWGGGGGGGGGFVPTTVVVTQSDGVVTTQYSAPYRVTSATVTGVFTTSSPTGTPVPVTGGTAASLSPGAIAGIVIGVLAGIAILLLLCFCCIARGLWNAIFGRKKKSRRERVEVVEEYSAHGSRVPSAHSRREHHTGWFAGGGRDEKKKKSSGAGWLGLAAGAATILALLNLRKNKKKDRKSRTSYSDSYYSYDGTSTSRLHPRCTNIAAIATNTFLQAVQVQADEPGTADALGTEPECHDPHGARSTRPTHKMCISVLLLTGQTL